jgi:hypothetical protein
VIESDPVIAMYPEDTVDFGEVTIQDTLSIEAFRVLNHGGGVLSGQAYVSSPFFVESGSPYSLMSGETSIIRIAFRPDSVGLVERTVSFTGGGGTERIVTGAGKEPEAVPSIVVNPEVLNFIAVQNGVLPESESLNISNGGGGLLNWNLDHTASWLDLSNDSGSSNDVIITVGVNRTDLQLYASYDTIRISANANNSPLIVPVNYYLFPPPSGADPSVRDIVKVGRIASIPPDTQVFIEVNIINDEQIGGFTR